MRTYIADKNYYWLFLVYLASNGMILISESLTYDDAHLIWMIKSELQTLYEVQSQYGNIPLYYWESIFSYFSDPAFYIRLTIFFFNAASTLFIYRILKSCRLVSDQESLLITLICMLLPLYMARMIINLNFHSVCTAFFYMGVFYLLELKKKNLSLFLYIPVFIFFIISFTTNSYLVFIYAAFLGIYYITHENIKINILDILLFLLPVIFWILKNSFMPVWGNAKSYNAFVFNLTSFFEIYFQSISLVVKSYFSSIFLVIFIFPALYYFYKYIPIESHIKINYASMKKIFFFGIAALVLSIFPYAIVDKPLGDLSFNDYNNRNALLVPLPAALIFFATLAFLVRNKRVLSSLLISFIVGFLFHQIQHNYYWTLDGIKRSMILTKLKTSDLVRSSHVITIRDEYALHPVNHFFGGTASVDLWLTFGNRGYFGFNLNEPKYFCNDDLKGTGFGSKNTFGVNVQPLVFDDKAPQVFLIVKKDPKVSNLQIFYKYSYYRITSLNHLNRFIDSTIIVKLYPQNKACG